MRVSDGSRLLVPLYHGTSELFLPSIRMAGLGAQDPHQQLATLSLLRDVIELYEALHPQDSEWLFSRLEAYAMLEQRSSPGGMNFRHGGTYLTASRYTAVRYALGNRYGSE